MIERNDLVIKLNHLILSRGFQKQSMSALARQAGVSRATLYLNFKNKDDLVQAVVDRHLAFIHQHQVPPFQNQNFLATWLNSLLLLGSTTPAFLADLQVGYPARAQQLHSATQTYLANLLTYLQQAQAANFLVSNLSPAFMLFQAQSLITQILMQVQAHSLPITDAEAYFQATWTLQLNGLIRPDQLKQLDLTAVASFEQTILGEFRATYALMS